MTTQPDDVPGVCAGRFGRPNAESMSFGRWDWDSPGNVGSPRPPLPVIPIPPDVPGPQENLLPPPLPPLPPQEPVPDSDGWVSSDDSENFVDSDSDGIVFRGRF